MGMSQKKAREHCGYQAKPRTDICSTCGAFAMDMMVPKWVTEPGNESYLVKFENGTYKKLEKNIRCTDHGFVVKKTARCNLWRPVAAKRK